MFQSQKGSALIISLIITVLIALMMVVLLEKIIPSAREIRGIENATIAGYKAESAIEE